MVNVKFFFTTKLNSSYSLKDIFDYKKLFSINDHQVRNGAEPDTRTHRSGYSNEILICSLLFDFYLHFEILLTEN